MTVKITQEDVAAQPIAVVRRRADLADLPRVVPDAMGEVWRFIRAREVTGTGRNVALYLDDAINLECGVEVPASFVGGEGIFRSETPGGRVAVAEHVGPYHLLGETHRAVRHWCTANGYLPEVPNWEVYGHWTDDPAPLRTTVYYLLREARAD